MHPHPHRRWLIVLGFSAGLAARAQQSQAPAPSQPAAAAPQGGDTSACRLIKDAAGNLVLDPSCPPLVLPSTPSAAPAQNTAPAAPQAPASKRFPFPGESDQAPSAPPASNNTPPGGPPDAPASKRFPYPGQSDSGSSSSNSSEAPDAQPPATAKPLPGQPPLTDAGSSGESSSSASDSSSSSSSGAAAADKSDNDDTDATPTRRRTIRRKLPPVSAKSASDQEAEDVQVAGFYQNDGNFKGAYDRARDAVSLDKDDPAAHLALAESARRLGKLDEAETEYKQCLALDPIPKVRKAAEHALKEMTGGGA